MSGKTREAAGSRVPRALAPLAVYSVSVAVKLLLVYTYASTDLDVHTNWLAITHSHHVKDWYADGASASIWTLDYPPFFAWFEYGLAALGSMVPPLRPFLDVTQNYYQQCSSFDACLLFQRLTVIASECILFAAVCFATMRQSTSCRSIAIFLILCHPGLIIVDHIHFQYNGMLLGLLLIAMSMASYGNDVLATVSFTMLLCFKHIFLYVAPAFGCYYLGLIWRERTIGRKAALFGKLAVAASFVLILAFGPLQYHGMIPQMLSRLFPVQRGLIHAYWAPNFWALYAAGDKVLAFLAGKNVSGSLTRGLVTTAKFTALPQVDSSTTALVTLASMAPALISLLRNPLPGNLWPAVVYCSLCSFMFGYHVHEKAILITLIPMAVIAAKGCGYAGSSPVDRIEEHRGAVAGRRFMFMSIVGTYSLFPLLIRPEEYVVKVSLLVGYVIIGWPLLTARGRRSGLGFGVAMDAYLAGLVAVEIYSSFVHGKVFGDAWPFVPLMLISTYCAVGVCLCWLGQLLDWTTPRARD
jgi:alpha-1,3-glucosyltransferase